MFVQLNEKVVINLANVASVVESEGIDFRSSIPFLTIAFSGGHETELDGWTLQKWNSMIMQVNLQAGLNGKTMHL